MKQPCKLKAEEIVEFKGKHQESLKRVNNKVTNNTQQGRNIQKELKDIEKKENDLKENLKSLEKLISIPKGNVKDINSKIEDIKGPFTKDLDEVMDSMKLRRVAYHGGALIGPDIYKIQLKPNFTKIANVFSLKSIKTSDFETKAYSSLELRRKILILF